MASVELKAALALVAEMQSKAEASAKYAEAKESCGNAALVTPYWQGRAVAWRDAEILFATLSVAIAEAAK